MSPARGAVQSASPNGNASATHAPVPQLADLRKVIVDIPIIGVTPLIMHRWSEKAKKMMLDKQTGATRTQKPPKDPDAEYQAAFYRLEDGTPGMPAAAFKAATINGARLFDGITMTSLQTGVITVLGTPTTDDQGGTDTLVPIEGIARMREDTPRNQTGVADLRYRPEFWPWRAVLRIQYIESVITLESLVNLVDAGGMGGVGDWRPSSPKSKTGTFGTYEVDREPFTG